VYTSFWITLYYRTHGLCIPLSKMVLANNLKENSNLTTFISESFINPNPIFIAYVKNKMYKPRFYHRSYILVRIPEWNRKLGRPRRRWEGNIKMDLTQIERDVTGFTCLRMGSSGDLLRKEYYSFGFHERRRNSWSAERLSASQETFCPLKLI
jgi:hypothetical protein